MKSTEVQTLATVVDSMRESIHADFLCLQDTQGKRLGRLLLHKRMHIFRNDKNGISRTVVEAL